MISTAIKKSSFAMQKTLIYIGASNLQLPAISWAKEAGLKVVVTDLNEKAPGIALADDYHQIGGTDVDGLLALAQEIDKHGVLAGCYCGSDFGLAAVAAIGAEFGVPAVSPNVVSKALDKVVATRILHAAGVLVPPGGAADHLGNIGALADSLGYPLFIKPTDSSGSRGVRYLVSPAELENAYNEAKRFSHTIMIESVIEGDHIDVNGLFVDNVFYPCGLLDRFFSPRPFSYPIWGGQPCSLNISQQQRVYNVVETGARALGINQGPVKADVIVNAGCPVVLEIAPRFHGDVSTSFVTPLATGNSAPRAWFYHLAGEPFEEHLPRDNVKRVAGWMGIFPEHPGTFSGLSDIAAAKRLPGITEILQLKNSGYHIGAIADNLAVMGFIWGEGDSLSELKANLDRARSTLRVCMY